MEGCGLPGSERQLEGGVPPARRDAQCHELSLGSTCDAVWVGACAGRKTPLGYMFVTLVGAVLAVGLDTDTVTLTIKTLSSHLVTLESIRVSHRVY
eukprot:1193043-Prorocentrum_minimum.AAC.2